MKEEAGSTKETRKPQELKKEALDLAEQIGFPAAARELRLHSSQLYGWRSKSRARANRSDVGRAQATEIAQLKRLFQHIPVAHRPRRRLRSPFFQST